MDGNQRSYFRTTLDWGKSLKMGENEDSNDFYTNQTECARNQELAFQTLKEALELEYGHPAMLKIVNMLIVSGLCEEFIDTRRNEIREAQEAIEEAL